MLLLVEVKLLLRDAEQKNLNCGAADIKTRLHVFRMFKVH